MNGTSDCETFSGTIREKARRRAQELLRHVPNQSKILLLGAATEIIEEAVSKNCTLTVLDLEKQKVGLELASATIEDGNDLDLVTATDQADYVIATGMIFVSGTADQVFRLANEKGKSLALFMETGSNFGKQLIGYGADVVLSEFFPYYDFYGETKYRVSTKDGSSHSHT